MSSLFLTIKKPFFDLIVSGVKKEEYREIKPFYNKRFFCKNYTKVIFQNGYSLNSPRIEVELLGIEKKNANSEWSAGYSGFCYSLKLGRIINIKNYNNGKKES